MRLDISTVLVAFLAISQTAAGPLRPGRFRRQQPSSTPSVAPLDVDSPGEGEDRFDVEPKDDESDAPIVSDPQEFPDETPSPIIVTLGPGASDNLPEDETPVETAPPEPTEVIATGEQSEAPTEVPGDGASSEPSATPSGGSPPVSTDAPSEVVTDEPLADAPPTSSEAEPTSAETDPDEASSSDPGAAPTPTEADQIEAPSSDPGIEPTSTETDPIEEPSSVTSAEPTSTETDPSDLPLYLTSTEDPDEPTELPTASGESQSAPSLTSTEASATETPTGGDDVGSGISSSDDGVFFTSNLGSSSATETGTETPTASPEASAPTDNTSDPVTSGTIPTTLGEPSVSFTSQTETPDSTSESEPTVEPTPPASEAPPADPITPTGTVLTEVPTVRPPPPPTVTDRVSPDTMAANLAIARDLNKVFSTLTPLSACSAGQGACIDGHVAQCEERGGAFVPLKCSAGTACFALPMKSTAGAMLGCFEEEMARGILDGQESPPQEGGESDTGPVVTITTTVAGPTVIVTLTATDEGRPVETPTSSAGDDNEPQETPTPPRDPPKEIPTSSAGDVDEPQETPTPPRDPAKEIPTSSKNEPEDSPSPTEPPPRPDEGVTRPPPRTSDAPSPTSDAPIPSDTLEVIDIPVDVPVEDVLRGDPLDNDVVATTVFITVTVRDGTETETVTVTATA